MALDYTGLRFSKGAPLVAVRHRKRVEADAALAAAYAEVDKRDRGKCVVTGRHTIPGAADPRVRREHHHLTKRSQSKAGIADARNIVTLCAEAHQLVEAGWLVLDGTDASRRIVAHWADTGPPKHRPFVIKSKRRLAAE